MRRSSWECMNSPRYHPVFRQRQSRTFEGDVRNLTTDYARICYRDFPVSTDDGPE